MNKGDKHSKKHAKTWMMANSGMGVAILIVLWGLSAPCCAEAPSLPATSFFFPLLCRGTLSPIFSCELFGLLEFEDEIVIKKHVRGDIGKSHRDGERGHIPIKRRVDEISGRMLEVKDCLNSPAFLLRSCDFCNVQRCFWKS